MAKLFDWVLDAIRQPKIIDARLDAEFEEASNHVNVTQSNSDATTQGELQFNEINVTSNTKVLPGSPSSTQAPFADHVAAGQKITLTEGANAGGFQIPLLVRLNHTVATNIWEGSTSSDHIGLAVQAYSNAADTAIGGEGAGMYGSSIAAMAGPSAVHQHFVAFNAEMISDAGSVLQNRVGIRTQSYGTGSQGLDIDAAHTILSTAANAWKDGFVFGEPNIDPDPPLSTTGTIMRAEFPFTVTNGFYFPNVTFSGDAINVPGFIVRGTGVTAGQVESFINTTAYSGYSLTNQHSGGVASFTAINNSGAIGDFGIRGSARATYGALVAGDAYIYGNGATGVTIMADNATGVIKLAAGGNAETARLTTAALSPSVNDGIALGTTSLKWSDLHLASGAVLNFNNGNYTATHSSGILTFSGIVAGTTSKGFSVTAAGSASRFDAMDSGALAADATFDAGCNSVCLIYWRNETSGGGALVAYDGGNTNIIYQNGTNFVTGADPGSGTSKIWIRAFPDHGKAVNRYATSQTVRAIILGG